MAIEDFYTAHTYESVLSSDSWGGNSSSGFDVLVNVDGFLQFKNGSENNQFSNTGEKITAIFYTDISNDFIYGSRLDGKYKVISGDQENGISGVGHHKEILLGAFS